MYTMSRTTSFRGPGRSRSRSNSDPGYPYTTPPYRTAWPPPARRQSTDPAPPTNESVESHEQLQARIAQFQPPPGSLLAQQQQNASRSPTNPSTPRSPSPHRSHRRSTSSVRRGPLIPVPPPPGRTALTTPPHTPGPHVRSSSQVSIHTPSSANYIPPQPVQGHASMHSSSHHSMQQGTHYQGTHHNSNSQHQSPSHQPTHRRSRSRPPSRTSHHRSTSATGAAALGTLKSPPASSVTLNASRVSLNATTAPKSLGHQTTVSSAHSTAGQYPGQPTNNAHQSQNFPSSEMRSRSLPRAQPKTVKESRPDPPSTPAATKTTPQRPPLPHATTSQMNTEYVNMLLALDGIPRLHNMYASFFTWILLAGFVLFPGTFTTWQEKEQQQGLGSTVTQLINAVQDVPLFIIAWICTGIGAAGMLWLWWRWRNNYVWIVNRIFVPGLLNSLAGIISTITSVYGGHQGEFTTTSKSTIIVTAAVALVCGVLTGWYQFWKLRLVKKQHDKEVGRELTGKHGEGVLSR